MTVKLQTNRSEKNKVHKDIVDIATLSGTLRENTSIIDPIIVIEGNPATFINTNYMTIPDFNRSYFINNIVVINNNLFEVHAHVDVLSSFESDIRLCRGIIKRQSYKWNLYLNDGVFRTYQNANITTLNFPSGFNTQEFVLVVAGS